MEPIRTNDMEHTLVGPEGSDVEPLPARVEGDTTLSVWELDDLEKRQIAEGGRVGLVVLAFPPPPVSLGIAPPYCRRCGAPMSWSDMLATWVCPEEEPENDNGADPSPGDGR